MSHACARPRTDCALATGAACNQGAVTGQPKKGGSSRDLQPAVTLAGGAVAGLAGRFVLARHVPAPRPKRAAVGNCPVSTPIFSDHLFSDDAVNAGDRHERGTLAGERGNHPVDLPRQTLDRLVTMVEVIQDLTPPFRPRLGRHRDPMNTRNR